MNSRPDILREKKVGNGADFMVRCMSCQHVHTIEFRPPPARHIPFILTEGPNSERVVLVVDADEEFVVRDVFEEDEENFGRFTKLKRRRRYVSSETATNIARITALRTDMVRVKLTLTRGEDSTADVIVVSQETTFTGSTFDGAQWRNMANSGHPHGSRANTPKARSRPPTSSVCICTNRPIPNTSPLVPLVNDVKRWKEGRLGFNPNPERPKEHVKKGVDANATKKRTNKKKRK